MLSCMNAVYIFSGADLRERTGDLVRTPLILGKREEKHRTKKRQQGKQNKTSPPPLALSSRSRWRKWQSSFSSCTFPRKSWIYLNNKTMFTGIHSYHKRLINWPGGMGGVLLSLRCLSLFVQENESMIQTTRKNLHKYFLYFPELYHPGIYCLTYKLYF